MDLATSLALHASGVDAWNGWASSCMERRRELVSTGMWCWERDSRTDTVPLNAETRSWMQNAAAQFSYHEFAETPDFSSFVFPGAALFVAAKLPQGARFRGARFRDGACFNFAHFGATAVFDAAVFCSIAEFRNTHFVGEAHFRDCHFEEAEFEPTSDGRIDCSDACFAMPASFARIHCRAALLADTRFEQAVSFESATITELFFVHHTRFCGPVSVQNARFPHDIDWAGAKLNGSPHSG